MEKRNKQQHAYRIRVRLENVRSRSATQQSITDLSIGDRVRVVNDRMPRY